MDEPPLPCALTPRKTDVQYRTGLRYCYAIPTVTLHFLPYVSNAIDIVLRFLLQVGRVVTIFCKSIAIPMPILAHKQYRMKPIEYILTKCFDITDIDTFTVIDV